MCFSFSLVSPMNSLGYLHVVESTSENHRQNWMASPSIPAPGAFSTDQSNALVGHTSVPCFLLSPLSGCRDLFPHLHSDFKSCLYFNTVPSGHKPCLRITHHILPAHWLFPCGPSPPYILYWLLWLYTQFGSRVVFALRLCLRQYCVVFLSLRSCI